IIRRPPRSTQSRSSAASDVYKRQLPEVRGDPVDEGRLPGAGGTRHPEDVGAPRVPVQFLQGADRRGDLVVQVPHQPRRGPGAVSYTHLTLPTIYSV